MDVDNPTVDVVVGGSKGLGRAITEQLLEQGHQVAIMSRTIEVELSRQENLDFINLDLCNPDDIKNAASVLWEGYAGEYNGTFREGLGYFFVCAGLGYQGGLQKQADESIHAIFQTLLEGPTYLLRQLLIDYFPPAHIITVSSTTASKVRANETVYGAAKAGQAQLARNFHQELIKLRPDAKSTLVHPGGMDTPFWEGTDTNTSGFMEPNAVASVILAEIAHQKQDWAEFSIPRSAQPSAVYGTPIVEFPS